MSSPVDDLEFFIKKKVILRELQVKSLTQNVGEKEHTIEESADESESVSNRLDALRRKKHRIVRKPNKVKSALISCPVSNHKFDKHSNEKYKESFISSETKVGGLNVNGKLEAHIDGKSNLIGAQREEWMTKIPDNHVFLNFDKLGARKFSQNVSFGGRRVNKSDVETTNNNHVSSEIINEYDRVNRSHSLLEIYCSHIKSNSPSKGSIPVIKVAGDLGDKSEGCAADPISSKTNVDLYKDFNDDKNQNEKFAHKIAVRENKQPVGGIGLDLANNSLLFERSEGYHPTLKEDGDHFNWHRDIESTSKRPSKKTLSRLEQRFGTLTDRFGDSSLLVKRRFL